MMLGMFTPSSPTNIDVDPMTQLIESRHNPDPLLVDVKPVVSIVDDILQIVVTTHEAEEATEVEKADNKHERVVNLLAEKINKISYEITRNCVLQEVVSSSALKLLEELKEFNWVAKAVISLAAFAVSHFWLADQLVHTRKRLAKNIAALKYEYEEKNFGAEIVDFLKTLLSWTHIVMDNSPEMEAFFRNVHIPKTVFGIIKGILSCASKISKLGNLKTAEFELKQTRDYLKTQLQNYETKRIGEGFNSLKECFEISYSTKNDKKKKLRKLILPEAASDDQIQLFHGEANKDISFGKVLKALDVSPWERSFHFKKKRTDYGLGKYTLLFISTLDLWKEQLDILLWVHNQGQSRKEYEVIWLPIVDKKEESPTDHEKRYKELRKAMPWYSLDPHLIKPAATMFIQEVWRFSNQPILVVLDQQGKVLNKNALPQIFIWGSTGFRLSELQVSKKWTEHSCLNIKLLADDGYIDQHIHSWIEEERIICLYGGEDIEWIRQLTSLMQTISRKYLQVQVEMLYVGKRNHKENVRRCNEIINKEQLSHTCSRNEPYDYVDFFWVRLMSMWDYKLQHGMTVENDPIMREVKTLLTYDSSEQGWAAFSRGIYEMTRAKGDILISVLEDHNRWGTRVDHADKFVTTLAEEISGVHSEHHCNCLILPGHSYIPERVVCSECGRTMDKFVMYRCCSD